MKHRLTSIMIGAIRSPDVISRKFFCGTISIIRSGVNTFDIQLVVAAIIVIAPCRISLQYYTDSTYTAWKKKYTRKGFLRKCYERKLTKLSKKALGGFEEEIVEGLTSQQRRKEKTSDLQTQYLKSILGYLEKVFQLEENHGT
ncbi:hypothetical protein CEXT_391731 [Caerostris extrusa]|uniref:Uncharacterized protein n=1 Tax=Caerostris extrusa TaxID=172846 RepID=A0AAV4UED0_CAEEX|nr:hypothetical protein CEXT_391731 [Caerostris extrusa]